MVGGCYCPRYRPHFGVESHYGHVLTLSENDFQTFGSPILGFRAESFFMRRVLRCLLGHGTSTRAPPAISDLSGSAQTC